MTTTDNRKRLDEEARSAHESLIQVVYWQFVGSSEGQAVVEEMQGRRGSYLDSFTFEPVANLDEARRVAERWEAYRSLRSTVRRMARDSEWIKNPLAQELLDQTLELEERLEDDTTGLDAEWRVKEVVDHLADVVTTLHRELDHKSIDDPVHAAKYVTDYFGDVDQGEVGELLGVDPRTVRDWKAGRAKTIRKDPDRVILVAQLVYDLSRMMTPRGVLLWFRRPRHQLDDKSPMEAIEQGRPGYDDELRSLARGSRGQLAT